MWMFGILSSALGRKCEPAHELEKTAKLIQLCLHLWSPECPVACI